MASASANTEKKSKTSSPLPKRGQVKGKIFEDLARTVVSAASKVGKALGSVGGGAAGSGGNSAAPTPPPSAYNSDGN